MIATARMAVSTVDNLEKEAIKPYDRVFANGDGEYVHGSVVAIEKEGYTGGHVVLQNGTRIQYHVLILATGSIWEGPSNIPDDPEEIQRFLNQYRTTIKNAKNIVVAGGGSVGIGELFMNTFRLSLISRVLRGCRRDQGCLPSMLIICAVCLLLTRIRTRMLRSFRGATYY